MSLGQSSLSSEQDSEAHPSSLRSCRRTSVLLTWQLHIFCVVQIRGSFDMYGIVVDPLSVAVWQALCKSGTETYTA